KTTQPIGVRGHRFRGVEKRWRNIIGHHRPAQAAAQVMIGAESFINAKEILIRWPGDMDRIITIVYVIVVGLRGVVWLREQSHVVGKQSALAGEVATRSGWYLAARKLRTDPATALRLILIRQRPCAVSRI